MKKEVELEFDEEKGIVKLDGKIYAIKVEEKEDTKFTLIESTETEIDELRFDVADTLVSKALYRYNEVDLLMKIFQEALKKYDMKTLLNLQERLETVSPSIRMGSGCVSLKVGGLPGATKEVYITGPISH